MLRWEAWKRTVYWETDSFVVVSLNMSCWLWWDYWIILFWWRCVICLLLMTLFCFSRLPYWVQSFIPKIFYVTEKAWNYYPYTITEYTVIFNKFFFVISPFKNKNTIFFVVFLHPAFPHFDLHTLRGQQRLYWKRMTSLPFKRKKNQFCTENFVAVFKFNARTASWTYCRLYRYSLRWIESETLQRGGGSAFFPIEKNESWPIGWWLAKCNSTDYVLL